MTIRKLTGLVILILLAVPAVWAKPTARRITFRPGAVSARVVGRLRGIRDEAWFVLRARKGQRMRVEADGAGSTRVFIHFPNGDQDGAPGAVETDPLPVSGDYRIRVTESQMGEAWRGRFVLKVTIK